MVRLRLLPLPDKKKRKPPMQQPKLLRTPEPLRDIVRRSAAVRGIPGTLPAEGRREQEPELETLPARARAALALVTERAVAEQGRARAALRDGALEPEPVRAAAQARDHSPESRSRAARGTRRIATHQRSPSPHRLRIK